MSIRSVTLVMMCLPLASCWTTLKVGKVDGENRTTMKGVRYSLPIPVLRVTPKSDGTLDVGVEYLPDASRTYAINSSSWLGKHQLDVSVENGMLKKVLWNADSAAVAGEVASSSADVGKAVIEARAAEEKAQREADEAKQKEREGELKTAREAVENAAHQVDLARGSLLILRKSPAATPPQILAAELELAKAEQNLRAAEARLAALLAAEETRKNSSMNLLADAKERAVEGPVLYEIQNFVGSVALKSLEEQQTFKTTTVPPVTSKPPLTTLTTIEGLKEPRLPSRMKLSLAEARESRAQTVLAALKAGGSATKEQIGLAERELATAQAQVLEAKELSVFLRASKPIESYSSFGIDGLAGDQFEFAQETPTRFWLKLEDSVTDGEYILSFKAGSDTVSMKLHVRKP